MPSLLFHHDPLLATEVAAAVPSLLFHHDPLLATEVAAAGHLQASIYQYTVHSAQYICYVHCTVYIMQCVH